MASSNKVRCPCASSLFSDKDVKPFDGPMSLLELKETESINGGPLFRTLISRVLIMFFVLHD